jgi:hypothetical protein
VEGLLVSLLQYAVVAVEYPLLEVFAVLVAVAVVMGRLVD